MKKILITGSEGQLGRALNSLLTREHDILVKNTDVDDLDIGNIEQVNQLITNWRPEFIINCAAYTAVDECESKEELAFYINANGPKNLAKAAEKVHATLIHISTDYVFDGNNQIPYVESDQTNPQSVYGASKLAGEENVINHCNKYMIIRTAWLYGDGKNFVRTMLRLGKEKEEISVVQDQHGTPTSALELARLILFLMEKEQYGIYHGTCEGETNWYEFALEIFRLAELPVRVKPVTSLEYKTPTKRPAYSVLENKHLNTEYHYRMKEWKEALQEFMKGELEK